MQRIFGSNQKYSEYKDMVAQQSRRLYEQSQKGPLKEPQAK